ncbi:MAG: hypothetical protein VX075_16610, partial [Pseudomonadota bacterium]|nr:hypothetical protein [Pseudomonadota bacterium]
LAQMALDDQLALQRLLTHRSDRLADGGISLDELAAQVGGARLVRDTYLLRGRQQLRALGAMQRHTVRARIALQDLRAARLHLEASSARRGVACWIAAAGRWRAERAAAARARRGSERRKFETSEKISASALELAIAASRRA